ncbi:tetratricopeptide repeat protein [Polaribacter sp. R2A056_3_33]|uniref:ATP-binding protein n=1 Tax=Polaribacter sp. R2A056_3_33 TaxID=2745563 RepID=UPI001C4F2D9A|nr:tetratricopeptide repeat-containing sensor histidine kinase [Polaribacter sp. R2A056_3_33]QXP68988.1 tetratricopeptide repeat protein [Polaribacter sp. R2A056_3_33]
MKGLNKVFLFLFFGVVFKALPIEKEAVLLTASFSMQLNDSTLIKSFKNIDKLYKDKKFDLALKNAFILLDSSKYRNNSIFYKTNFIIGNIFYETLSFKDGIKYFRINVDSMLKDSLLLDNKDKVFEPKLLLIQNYLRLGSSYHKLKERDYLEGTDKLNKYRDSTLFYYYKVLDFNDLNKTYLDTKAKAYSNLSAFYINDSLYDLATKYANKSIEIHKLNNNKINQAAALGNLASIYLIKEDFNLAKKIYLEGLELIKNDNSAKAVRFKASLYANLSWAMYKLKDYKAYEFQEISYGIKDELRDTEIRGIVKTIKAEYDVDTVKKLVLKEEENKRLKNQRTFWMLGIGGLIIIITLLYVLNFYKLRQKNLRLELTQTQLVQYQNLEKIKSDAQVRILNATIDGKESERKQIAETLHDSVSALLSSANLHLQAARGLFKGDIPIEIDKSQHIIKEASQTIRDLSHTLVSSVLLKFGLKYALKDMADKYSNSQIKIDTRVGETRRYEQNFEIKVYNIIQEFINNILKHSKAEKAMIKLDESDGKLYLRISDDGVGFDKKKIIKKEGLGLNQIDARIQMMQGEFHIDTAPKNGTVIKVILPILEKKKINLV